MGYVGCPNEQHWRSANIFFLHVVGAGVGLAEVIWHLDPVFGCLQFARLVGLQHTTWRFLGPDAGLPGGC